MEYGVRCPPSKFKTQVSRGADEQIYVELHNPERIVGEVRAARGWLALGRKVHTNLFLNYCGAQLDVQGVGNLVTSRDMIRSCKVWMGTCNLLAELELLAHRVNACIKFTDRELYENLLVFRQKHLKAQKAIEAISSIDPLLYKGRELLYNVRLSEHIDGQDPRRSLSAFSVFGEFRGGYLSYRALGIRVRFRPGDMNLLRGRVVPHEVEPFVGQRIAIPHFTHTSCWRALDMEELVN
jgi:hypothetical protein